MSLYTGKRLHSYIWEEIPIYQDTIDRVDQLAQEETQPVLDNIQPLFEWISGKEIEDYQHDPIIQQEEEPQENEIDQQPERETEHYITD